MRISLSNIVLVGSVLCLTACVPKPSDYKDDTNSSSSVSLFDEKQTAAKALDALMEKDMTELAKYVHPKKGVRFTAETHVRKTKDEAGGPADNVVYADQLEKTYESMQTEVWGVADGSGEPIDITMQQYFAKYVTDQDYRKAPVVTWNKKSEHGSTIDNAAEVYPGAQIVEYYFPGFEEQYGGMDWAALRLVFEQDTASKKWYLVGVIHDHWTP